MKIYDTILFFNELALLRTRLSELSETVDQFVVVESPVTFSGRGKPLYFADNQSLFEEFKEQIIHVVVPDLPIGMTPFRAKVRKMIQRDAVIRGLSSAADEDLILLSNADEIPFAGTIRQGVDSIRFSQGAVLRMEEYRYGFYCKAEESQFHTIATTVKNLLIYTPSALREVGNKHGFTVIENGGWHLSCFLDGQGLQYKADACAEQHMIGTPIEKLEEARRTGIDVFGNSHLQRVDPHTQVVPRFIEENKDGLFKVFYTHPDEEAADEQFASLGFKTGELI